MSVVFLTNNLMFSSRLSGVADSHGIPVRVVGSRMDLLDAVSDSSGGLVVLDLSSPDAEPGELVPALRQLESPPGAIVAFAPHVHEAKLAAAVKAGCDEVLSQGQFHSQLEAIVVRFG